MKVPPTLAAHVPPAPPIEQSAAALISALHRIADQPGLLVLWPDGSETDTRRREHSHELARHFSALRRRARDLCPSVLLPRYEEELSEIEAPARAAVAGRLGPFWDVRYYVEQIELFRDKWTAYFDTPARVQFVDADRSVWVDGVRVGSGLAREGFAFVKVLVAKHPDKVSWSQVKNLARECRGKNATRVKNSLPRSVLKLIDSDNGGYALQLP